MKFNWILLFGLVVICSPIAENSNLESSKADAQQANRRNLDELIKTAKEYQTPASQLGNMMSSVLSMIAVDNAVAISLTNNHYLDLTDPHWYIVDGRLDSPPPDILKSKQTMVVTFERQPNKVFGLFTGTQGVLTYRIGTSYLLILWSAVATKTNKLLVKVIDRDPTLGGYYTDPSDLYDKYKGESWEAGDYGQWFIGRNPKINCQFASAMGNGDKAPLEVFLF